ncbi:MAG: N-acetyl-alpha-D-glucosaminyl L-malate synthase BshA [Bryobacteraceae bacterium]
MRIGITCYPTYGGSGIVATELGLELALRGHEIHFISYANPIRLDPGTPRIHYHEVEVSNYPLFHYPPYCLALASRMAEVAERYELDLLHVHYAIPHSISAFLAQQILAARRRVPFITTLHGTDITLVGQDRSYLPITRFSIERSDGITSISNYLQKRTVDVFGVANEIRVIYNFVNVDLYKPDPNRSTGEKLLLHISNFRPVKRPLDCIRILHKVRQRMPVRLLMAGDGPERGPAESLAQELGLARDVDFLGKQDHVERLIPKAHILLLPSELEAFGLAALEEHVMRTTSGGNQCGRRARADYSWSRRLRRAGGRRRLAGEPCISLLEDDDLRLRMSQAARQTAIDRFATALLIPQYENYYTEILQH